MSTRPVETSRILPGVPAVIDELRVFGGLGDFLSRIARYVEKAPG